MRARHTLIPVIAAAVIALVPGTADAHGSAGDHRASSERARVLALVKILTAPPPPATDPTSFIWPAHAPITSGFGRRGGRPHQGVDIDAPYGAPIVASQTGTVIFAAVKNGYGNTTIIDHGHGISTLYAHQSKILVRVGQKVTQGQLIGKVGSTGHVTAPHLHYEVHINGVPRNPMPWL